MPGVRLNGFLASTAVALCLSAGGAQAQTTPGSDAAVTAPDSTKSAPATASEPAKAPAPTAQTSDPVAAPATPAPSESPDTAASSAPKPSTDQPETPTPAAVSAPPPAAAPVNTGTATAPETPAPAPAAASAPPPAAPPSVDTVIADQLHQMSSGKYDHIFGGKAERTAVEGFYSSRSYAPLWITDGHVSDRATTAIGYLGHVDADGLDPADYPVPHFNGMTDPAQLAEAEIRLTASVLAYARHASIGRIHWSRVSADISYEQKPPEPASVLAALAEAKDVAATLDSYEPHASGYLALKAKLAEIRTGKGDGLKQPIPNGPVLKVGDQDERVPQLRDRLGAPGDGSTTYDKALAEAVKKFQKEHDLKPTGTLTLPTLDALNGPRPTHVTDIILANMERWRWMPHDLGKTYVIVNLPDYTLRVMHDGAQVWKTKIVIGKQAMPTPIMSAEMKFITVNPTWNVPPSIINHEYLPALHQDPTVLERMGLRVAHNPDGSVHIWQPPGDRNALGRIRFNFPNKFLVYQHDTPDKYMFNFEKRAFSHGCMRVFDPPKYAEVLLSLVRPNDGYTIERIKRMYGPNEVNIDFPSFIPVHLTYQTAFVDESGKLELREDVYGRDRALLAIMHGDERRIAEVPVEHRIDVSHRQVMAVPDTPTLWGGRGRSPYGPTTTSGEGFFSQLFGGFSQPQPPPRPVGHRRVSRTTTRYGDTVAR